MKVGIDARLYFETGVGRYIRNTLYELDRYCENNNTDKFYIFLSKKGFKTLTFKSHSLIKVEANFPWHSLKEQIGYAKLLNSYNLDLMHFTYFSLPVLYRRKFISTIHDLIINRVDTGKATTLPKPIYKIKRYFYEKVMKHSVFNSSFIISPSHSTKKEILHFYNVDPKKIHVIPEGVDSAFLKKNSNKIEHKKYILYVGNAYPHKNLDRLIDAYNLVKNKIDEELILVGKSDYFYKRLSLRIKNEKRITILNDVSDSDLSSLYSNASFLVAPSLIEGFGLTPLEAMGRGCFCLVASIDAFKEVCENAAMYFDPQNTENLASKMVEVSKMNNDEKNKFKKLFRDKIDSFSWEKSFKSTIELYERCYSLR